MAQQSVSTKMESTKKTAHKGKKLRVAIIGCGGIAQTHLDVYRTYIPEVEIVAGVDILQERLDVMEEKWGVPKEALFTDWKKMLAEIKPDAVDVCTPNHVHCAPVVDSCNAGCHAMVEKPMAMNPRECEKMIAAAEKAGVKLSVGFQQRYRPNTEALIEARDNDQFGDIFFVKVRALRRRGIPNWGVFGQKELQGGGPMIDIGVHMVEAAYELMGAPKPIAASGNTWTYMGNTDSKTRCPWPGWDWKTYTVEDFAVGQIRFDNGAIMQIESSFAAHIPHEVHNFEIIGTKGSCNWDSGEIFTDLHNTMVNIKPAYLGGTEWGALFRSKLQNWVDGCLKGSELQADGYDGLNVQKILDGIYRSAAAGKEVTIK
jgi:predicted dehydrogenase